MVNNPGLEVRKEAGNMWIALTGDLDDAAALQLINYLKHNGEGVPFIVIRTSGLDKVDAKARKFLISKLNELGGIRYHMLFPDDNNYMFAPGSCNFH